MQRFRVFLITALTFAVLMSIASPIVFAEPVKTIDVILQSYGNDSFQTETLGLGHALEPVSVELAPWRPQAGLVSFKHTAWQPGDWANDGNERVLATGSGPGSGWSGFKQVVSGGDGVLYGVKQDGGLVWYKNTGWQNGESSWANGGNERVLATGRGPGSGWSGFKQVVGGGDGILYGIKQDGGLVWYKHLGWQHGDSNWANGGNERVLATGSGPGSGWSGFKQVIGGGDGVLYGVKQDGTLVWYKHTGWQNGESNWANGGNERVLVTGRGRGSSWSGFEQVVSSGDGVLHGVRQDGGLVRYNHTGWQNGESTWANGGNERVLATGSGPGSGWSGFKQVVGGGEGILYGVKPNGGLVWYKNTGWQDSESGWANAGYERVLVRAWTPVARASRLN